MVITGYKEGMFHHMRKIRPHNDGVEDGVFADTNGRHYKLILWNIRDINIIILAIKRKS